jgi:uridine kinase
MLLILYTFYSYKKVNFDSLILILGLAFTVLIALVPPMQGWFYWSIPLLIFFLIKYKTARWGSFWAMNGTIILFYWFSKDSDLIESIAYTFPGLSSLPTPYQYLSHRGMQPILIQNLLFTFMQVLVGINAFWCYRIGKFYNQFYVEKERPFVFGIGGDSAVGKSTLTKSLENVIGKNNLVILNGDDAHKWERRDRNWMVYTHLNPAANRIHTDTEQLFALVNGRSIERVMYNHKNGKFGKPQTLEKNDFILFQGLHPFFLKDQRKIYNLKIYLEVQEKLRIKWKLERDSTKRGQEKEKIKRDIERRKNDAKRFIHPQKNVADWIIRYELRKKELVVTHTFANSLPLDPLLKALNHIHSLQIDYSYNDLNFHSLTVSGKIRKGDIEKVAYSLYPNVSELIVEAPYFLSDMNGMSQLLFITYLNYFYSGKRASYEGFY